MTNPLSSLLDDLSSLGWTISWAFQYAPDQWRMSIIQAADVGAEQGTYTTHCAFAPTFAEALEDCMSKLSQATWEADTPITSSIAPAGPSLSALLSASLRSSSPPIRRRT